jgi:glucan biosynthesis protein C
MDPALVWRDRNHRKTAMSNPTQRKGRDIAIDYLRAFVIVLVVFLHAALAYTSFSTFNAARYVDSSAPIVDASRWPPLDLVVIFFDTFFMALLFFVSGLFVLSSLERKGRRSFLLARLQRLGIPFVFAALLLAPLTYWPSYSLATPEPNTPYLLRFFTSDGWPVGPPWFLWLLLLFNGLVALTHRFAPSLLAKLRRQPTALAVLLVTIVAYLPLSLVIPPPSWMSLGPFDMQTSRFLLYLAYFLLGMATGSGQQWRSSSWPKHWGAWLLSGILSFLVYAALVSELVRLPGLISQPVISLAYAGSCAGTSLGLLGAFRRFVQRPHPIPDGLAADAYGIYIIHYLVVIWMQFALLSAPWPAWIKFGVAFLGGLALSLGTTRLARQIPAVRQIL